MHRGMMADTYDGRRSCTDISKLNVHNAINVHSWFAGIMLSLLSVSLTSDRVLRIR